MPHYSFYLCITRDSCYLFIKTRREHLIASAPQRDPAVPEYKPQIDGARFLAVFVVLIYHFFSSLQGPNKIFDLTTFIAFFFALSGYLITKILLVAKEIGLKKDRKRVTIAFVFLIRRTLRIFPAYYLYLLIIMLLPVGGYYLRNNAGMFFGYLSNFQIYKDQLWERFATPHLWTLAVEEQFYLIWPWLILFIPTRQLPKLFIFLIAAGIAFRLTYYALLGNVTQNVPFTVLTPACLDSFGLGGLLAYQHLYVRNRNPWIMRACAMILPLWIIMAYFGSSIWTVGFQRVFVSVFSLWGIEAANTGLKNLFGRFLQSKVVVYLGKISYGIYLYHLFAAFFFWRVFEKVSEFASGKGVSLAPLGNFLAKPFVNFIFYFITTVTLATLSWYLLEQPFNNLKRFIRIGRPKAKDALQKIPLEKEQLDQKLHDRKTG
ncbi:MAG: hypothetical protein C5B59_08895 [Bacteroidetes bacterium]|nr:MAG: hypothetical protein C5B59_08895 [Bacteroidota bacterium]